MYDHAVWPYLYRGADYVDVAARRGGHIHLGPLPQSKGSSCRMYVSANSSVSFGLSRIDVSVKRV